MDASVPILKDLVLIGGGHAHVAVLRRFGMKPMPGVRLTLITRDLETPYSGMLPGFIAGHYSFADCHIDLDPLARFARARLIHDATIGVDRAAKQVICRDRPPVPYDVLSIDIGSTPRQDDVPGAAEHAIPVKPIDRFARQWSELLGSLAERTQPTRIAVVGGGAGGVELLLAVRHALHRLARERNRDPALFNLALVTAEQVLPKHNAKARAIFRRVLAERGVAVIENDPVVQVGRQALHLRSNQVLAADAILWVTPAAAAPWLAASGFACDPGGFVRLRDTLQTETDPNVFAAGDCANVVAHPREKAGVFAVRQGPPLADNLRRVLAGAAPKPFVPQSRFLTLISTGERHAVAARGDWATEGAWVWRWKDWIDRRWMRRYQEPPAMALPAPPVAASGVADAAAVDLLATMAMRCGGCGAKIGAGILSRVMHRLQLPAAPDVVIGLDAPDDAAVIRPPPGELLVQTVDFFRDFIGDPFLFGRVAATHALGDIYAMGATPRTALAIATVPYGIEAKVEDTLYQLLAGTVQVLHDAGATLIGGHSAEAAELGLGLTINGAAPEAALLRKGGLRAGQKLILTKPLGTGALFAAAMRGKARGRWIEAALASMLNSSRRAAEILRTHEASAMTDVTGFGLIGHLREMLAASACEARLDAAAVPVLAGAEDVVAQGIFSTMQPENLRLRRIVQGVDAAPAGRIALLFDPQTSGGLLAGVPAEQAEACVQALRLAGYPAAAIVGSVEPQGAGPERIRLGS
jgi:selenide,water dikinase